MREIPWKTWAEKGKQLLREHRKLFILLLVGAVFLLWPEKKESPVQEPPPVQSAAVAEDFSVSALEEKLAQTLSKVQGAGEVTVMLTVQGGSRQVLATDEKNAWDTQGGRESQSTTVVVSGGSASRGEPVLIQQLYPKFQGALIVCAGGENAGVRLKLMEAVGALTGLGADKIAICKGKG